MTREQIEQAIKCCNPYGENCFECPFGNDVGRGCFTKLAVNAFSVLLEDRERLQKQVKEYQDKIENGTLIELPCKVGDTVYEVFKDHIPPFIKETKIEKIVITEKGLRLRLARNSFYETAISSLGKTVFLTREEAEKRLKELQE